MKKIVLSAAASHWLPTASHVGLIPSFHALACRRDQSSHPLVLQRVVVTISKPPAPRPSKRFPEVPEWGVISSRAEELPIAEKIEINCQSLSV